MPVSGRACTIALATCAAFPDGPADDQPLVAALRQSGATIHWAVWDDPAVDWAAFDLVLIRSTWDYTERPEQYLAWAHAVDRLVNPAAAVAWSADKRYLLDLAAAGVPIVPTEVIAPGAAAEVPDGRFVIKPSVGAGTRGAGRFDCSGSDAAAQREAALAHLAGLHAAGRTALVQPYIDAVDSRGETGLVFFGGQHSHAIRKSSMLPPGAAFRLSARDAGGQFNPDRIGPRRASAEEIAAAHRVLDAAASVLRDAHRGARVDLAYARVDLLPGPRGPVLIELELVEPSLFLRYGPPDAVQRFAVDLVERARRSAAT